MCISLKMSYYNLQWCNFAATVSLSSVQHQNDVSFLMSDHIPIGAVFSHCSKSQEKQNSVDMVHGTGGAKTA